MLSEAPEGWELVAVREMVLEMRGGSPLKPSDFRKDGIPVLHKGDIRGDGQVAIDDRESRYTHHEFVQRHQRSLVDSKFLVVTLRDLVPSGPAIGLIGKFLDDRTYILAQGAYGLRLNQERVVPDYLIWLSNTGWYRELMQATAIGSTQIHIRNDEFLSLKFPFPPLIEQRIITRVLNSVGEAIQATQAVIEQTRRVKEGLLQELLTKGIGHTRFKQTEIGEIPEDWEVKSAEAVCHGIVDCKNRTPPETKEGFAVIRTPNIRHGRFIFDGLKYTDIESYEVWTQRGKPKPGDVLITREAPAGEVALLPDRIGPACLGQRMMLYKPKPEVLNNRFMLYALTAPRQRALIAKLSGGSTVGHIRVGDIRALPIPIAPLAEQGKIASVIASVDEAITKAERTEARLFSLKTGLLQDLLTGKVRVSV